LFVLGLQFCLSAPGTETPREWIYQIVKAYLFLFLFFKLFLKKNLFFIFLILNHADIKNNFFKIKKN